MKGKGTDGTAEEDAILEFKGNKWHLKLSTKNFSDPHTLASTRYYQVTISVIDNATLLVVGTTTVILETK